jgi:hypothetical protein
MKGCILIEAEEWFGDEYVRPHSWKCSLVKLIVNGLLPYRTSSASAEVCLFSNRTLVVDLVPSHLRGWSNHALTGLSGNTWLNIIIRISGGSAIK